MGVQAQLGNEGLPALGAEVVPSRGGGGQTGLGSRRGSSPSPLGTHPGPAEHTVGPQNASQVLRSWISAGVTDILSREGAVCECRCPPAPVPRCPDLAPDPSRPDIHLDIHAKSFQRADFSRLLEKQSLNHALLMIFSLN